MYFVNLKGAHFITDKLQVSGNAYNRNNRSYSSNGNTNEACDGAFTLTTCTDVGGNLIDSGSIGTSLTQENGTGVNLQTTSDYKVMNHDNQLTVGGGYNYGNTNFIVGEQNAVFNESHYENATEPVDTTVSINGQNTYTNVFATNTFSVFDWLHTNASMNWMHANVQTTDKIGTALNGNNTYARVNPSAGLTFNPLDALSLNTPLKELTTYFNYNEGFRVPTALELSCADEAAPCSLPNSFVSDPPLQAVVSHTLEVGARGNFSEALKWNFALYQTQTTNDILFVSSTNPTTGYFQNVGGTQRQGGEFGMSGLVFESLNWYVSYGFVDATYQSTEELSNGLQDGSTNLVTPGKRMPSIPQNTFKFGSEYEVFRNGFFGGDLQYVSSQYARGDDQNQYAQISGYAVVNLNARYVVTKNIELYAMGRNIFDNHYASFGQIGQNAFQDDALTTFKGPGAPATGYAGVRVHWD
jgi:outer membrane receptor protein involved in Fe transport